MACRGKGTPNKPVPAVPEGRVRKDEENPCGDGQGDWKGWLRGVQSPNFFLKRQWRGRGNTLRACIPPRAGMPRPSSLEQLEWRCLHGTDKMAAHLNEGSQPPRYISSASTTTFDNGYRLPPTGARRSTFLVDGVHRCPKSRRAELEHQTNKNCLWVCRRSSDDNQSTQLPLCNNDLLIHVYLGIDG